MADIVASSPPKAGRALFLAADLPWPPDGGGRIATLHVLEAMSRRYEVDLVAMADPVGDPDLEPLRALCRSVEVVRIPFTFGRHRVRQSLEFGLSLLSGQPYRLRKFRSRRFEAAVRRHLASGSYDLFHCDQFGVAPYVRLAPPEVPTTMGHQNVESEIYRLAGERAGNPIRRLLAAVEERKLRRAESGLASFDRVFVLAADDAELLGRLGVERTTMVPMPARIPAEARSAPPTGHRILSVGSMSWYGVADGLLWFHGQVLPLIRERVPDVEWELVGANAPSAIRRLDGEPGVHVTGHVPEMAPHVAVARVGIVPLRIAGGIRMKLLDCLAWGLPSVATSVGSRGLDLAEGDGCFTRDDPAGFAEAVVALLTDDRLWSQTAAAGRKFVAERHSVERLDRAIGEGIEAAIQHRGLRGIRPVQPAEPPAVQIGSILIDNVTQDEADAIIGKWLDEGPVGPRRVCTPNVDYVIRAGRDPAFRGALNGCDLKVPDGMWIVYASRIAGRGLRGTVTGRLLLPRFATRCREAGRPIAMMGAGPGVAAIAAERLGADNPGLVATAVTPPTPFVIGSDADNELVETLKAVRPAILFVALGAPKQELWMERHAGEFPESILIGVGAAFDVVAGRVREAPAWMTRTGLEWLFRLAQEPRRLARRYLWDDPRILGWAVATRVRGLVRRPSGPKQRS